MANKTRISWCDSTFNPWIGCTKISPGCDHCYAERQMDQRLGRVRWGAGQPRQRTAAENWRQVERWNAEPFFECPGCGWRGTAADYKRTIRPPAIACCPDHNHRLARRRVFACSLADVFDAEVPTDWRRDLYALIERTPNLDWLVLTKRIGNARAMLGECSFGRWDSMPLPSVWLGATVVNQHEADRDIPKLLATPAALRFVSIEPMLGPIDLYDGDPDPRLGGIEASQPFIGEWWEPGDAPSQPPRQGVDWVICGGESGPGARPMNPAWVLSLRDQCQAAGVPFFFKQWGAWAPNCLCDKNTACREIRRPEPGEPGVMFRCGKAGGHEIRGHEWLEFPALKADHAADAKRTQMMRLTEAMRTGGGNSQ